MARTRISSAKTMMGFALLLFAGACAESIPTAPGPGPMLQHDRESRKGVRLLACPTREALYASGVVGPEGGTVVAGDHGIRIPAGALTMPVRIALTAPAGPRVRIDITAGGSESLRFEQPVEVTISYARCRQPVWIAGVPSAWYIDGETGILLEGMEGVDDPKRRSVTFRTIHLSTYAVAY